MKWRFDDVVAFVQVVQAGSITAAANRMNLAKSVVSKRIHDLERALDAELFQRSIRQLRPTETGLAEARVALIHEELVAQAPLLMLRGLGDGHQVALQLGLRPVATTAFLNSTSSQLLIELRS